MDEEHLGGDLQVFQGRKTFQKRLRSFVTIYVLLGLCFLLSITLFSVSLSRVSALSSQLSHWEWNQSFSGRDLLLFPCDPTSREWEYFGGNCYYFSLSRTSWHQAKEECEGMQAHLAKIDSYAKQRFVMFRTRDERFWIGLSDHNAEGSWRWLDGTDSQSGFTFWKEGEPNDSENNEDCAHVWTSGEWNDVYCTYQCYYICEKPLPH